MYVYNVYSKIYTILQKGGGSIFSQLEEGGLKNFPKFHWVMGKSQNTWISQSAFSDKSMKSVKIVNIATASF